MIQAKDIIKINFTQFLYSFIFLNATPIKGPQIFFFSIKQ